ncbi:MAG: Maf family nucleotide pyrophosphatase [Muribaculaceae bacterium]|nr:Maf family nucleotide pyrophosphatase [Muribaculaceae bacterium]
MLSNLNKYHVLLASKSPRRRELLQLLRIPFSIITINGLDETYPDTVPPLEVPQYISSKKADAYQSRLHDNELIITADTMVVCDDRIYGKPHNDKEAIEMLMSLASKTHHVATGVTISTSMRRTSFTTVTAVTFCMFSEEEARYYVDNYMPLDKAGAYGIQEWIGAIAVERLDGSYYNVMGLPVHRLYQELRLF